MKCYTISRFSATLTLSLLNIRFSVFSLLLNRITLEVNLALFYQIVWISCRKFTEVSRSCYVHQKNKKKYSVDKVDIDIALYLIHENSDVNQKGKAYFVGNKELVRIF